MNEISFAREEDEEDDLERDFPDVDFEKLRRRFPDINFKELVTGFPDIDLDDTACIEESWAYLKSSGQLRLFGKGVMLSNDQIESLLKELSTEEFDKYVDIVAECEAKGKHYKRKTHYQAILDMAKKDRKINQ